MRDAYCRKTSGDGRVDNCCSRSGRRYVRCHSKMVERRLIVDPVVPAMRITISILACVLLIGCTPADERPQPAPAAASAQPDARQVAATYQTLRAMTKEPVFVDPGLAMLCRGATQAEVEA